MSTALDNVKMKIAFSADPMDTSPTWVDVTDRLRMDRGISITRGRADQFATVSPGSATFTLDNTDGYLTPGNPSSPYYPNVKPQNRVWIYYDDSPFTWSRFDGFIEAWPVAWPAGGQTESTVTVTAYDLSSRIGRARKLGSVIAETYRLQTLVAHWPLSEPSEATTAVDTVGGRELVIQQVGSGGTIEFGAGTGPGTDGATAVVLTPASAGNGKFLRGESPWGRAPVTYQTVSATFNTSSATTQTVVELSDGFGEFSFALGVKSTGYPFAEMRSESWWGGVSTTTSTGGTSAADGETHTIAATAYVTGGVWTVDWYFDGSFEATIDLGYVWAGAEPPVMRYIDVGYGRLDNVSAPFTRGIFSGTLSHVAAMTTALDASAASEMHLANSTGFAGETADARVERIASWIGLDPVFYELDACTATMEAVDCSGMDPWSYMQLCADTEAGFLYVAENGDVTLRNRDRMWATGQAAVLSVDADEIGEALEVVVDLQRLVNDVEVTRTRGGSVRAVDQDSIDAYGEFGRTVSTALDTAAALADRAEWEAAAYSVVSPYIPGLGLDGLTSTVASSARLIALDDRIEISSLPSQAPPNLGDLRVEGYTEDISAAGWAVTCNTVPHLTVTPLILDDATYGELDAGNRLAL